MWVIDAKLCSQFLVGHKIDIQDLVFIVLRICQINSSVFMKVLQNAVFLWEEGWVYGWVYGCRHPFAWSTLRYTDDILISVPLPPNSPTTLHPTLPLPPPAICRASFPRMIAIIASHPPLISSRRFQLFANWGR